MDIVIKRKGSRDIPLESHELMTKVKSAQQNINLLGDDIVNIQLESVTKRDFFIGDRIEVYGRSYTLNRLPVVRRLAQSLFEYNLEFEGVQYELARATYDLTIDTTENELQDIQADALMGDLKRFADVLISNANRVMPNTWMLGARPNETETKNLMFGEQDNCLSVLQTLCDEFDTEFEIEETLGNDGYVGDAENWTCGNSCWGFGLIKNGATFYTNGNYGSIVTDAPSGLEKGNHKVLVTVHSLDVETYMEEFNYQWRVSFDNGSTFMRIQSGTMARGETISFSVNFNWDSDFLPKFDFRIYRVYSGQAVSMRVEITDVMFYELSKVKEPKRILHLRKAGSIQPMTFEYGKGKGLYNLSRENASSSNIVTRLKVFGGTQNLTHKYRAQRLCLPNKSKGQSFIEKVEAVNNYGIWENTKYFEDIFPTRLGTVTAVSGELTFSDDEMFDLNKKTGDDTDYLIAGLEPTIAFISGNLAGYEFVITDYNHSTKTFTIKQIEDENGYKFPDASKGFVIAPENQYRLLNISLPQSYIDTAEELLAEKGEEYYDQNSQPKVQYQLTVAEDYLKGLEGGDTVTNFFKVGDYVGVLDNELKVDKSVRVKGFVRDIFNPYSYTLTISDVVERSIINRLISDSIEVSKVIQINKLKDPARAAANWKTSREVLDMVFDTEGDFYTDKIKPESIDTLALSVGAKSTQFGLQNTVFEPNYQGGANNVKVKGGVLQHFAITNDSGVLRSWTMNNATFSLSLNQPYYLYARCYIESNNGEFVFAIEKRKVDYQSDAYTFLVGVLSSVDAVLNIRSLTLTHGFSMINGGFISTGRIQSFDGQTYFDLDTGEIAGSITFTSGGQKKVLRDYINNELIPELEDISDTIGGIEGSVSDLDTYIDGAFADGLISQAEAKAIEKYINSVNEIMVRAESSYEKVYNNTYLSGTPKKSNLKTAKNNLWNKRDTLMSAINTAIADDKVTPSEKTAVDTAFSNFNTAMSSFTNALEEANKSIQIKLDEIAKGYASALEPLINEAKQDAQNAQTSANSANSAVGSLNTYVDGAFKDGVIDSAEAKAIEKYINSVNEIMVRATSSYDKVYNNTYLSGTPKSNLATAKNNLWNKKDTLLSAINTAIADGETTPSEKTAVDTAFGNFNTDMGLFTNAIEDANKAIQIALDNLSKGYVDAVQVGGRNLLGKTNQGAEGWAWMLGTSGASATVESVVEGGVNTVRMTRNAAANSSWSFIRYNHIGREKYKPNTEYTLSLFIKSSVNTYFRARLQRVNGTDPIIVFGQEIQAVAGEWTKIVFKGTSLEILPSTTDQVVYLSDMDNSPGVTYQFKDLKLELGNRATDWTPAPEDVQTEINTVKQDAQNAQTSANNANSAVGSLNTYVDGAFKDGVIDSAEAVAIEKYINSINETMAKSEESYSVVYMNTYLEGDAKMYLQNAKINLWGQRDTLINKINEVIADGKVTSTEKSQVDSAFSTFNGLMKSFTEMLEKANKAIQVKLDNLSKGYVNDLEIGAVNYILNSELKGSSTGWMKNSLISSVTDTNEGVKIARTDNVNDARGMFSQYIPNTFSLNDEVVLSAYLRLDSGTLLPNTTFIARFFNSSGATVQDISFSLFERGVDGTYKRYHEVGKITNENVDFTKDVEIILAIPKGVSTIQMRNVQLEKGNKLTGWKLASKDIESEIDNAKQQAQNAQTSANNANSAVGSLNTYVDGAFKDGVIDSAEAKAIEKYINTVRETMAKATSSYNAVYSNDYLTGAAKGALASGYGDLTAQHTTLVNAIQSAIADGKVTPVEKTAVDTAFENFSTAMSGFTTALENANKAIQIVLDSLAQSYVDDIQIGGKNYIKNSELKETYKGWLYDDRIAPTLTNDGIILARTDVVNPSRAFFYQYIPNEFDLGDKIVLSGYFKLESGTINANTHLFVRFFDSSGATGQDISVSLSSLTSTEERFVAYGTISHSSIDFSKDIQVVVAIPAGVTSIRVRNLQLERGTKVTDWRANENDSFAAVEYISKAMAPGTKTDVTGGLVATNVLLMKDTNGTQTGGLSGLADDNVGFWTGGTYQQALEDLAKVIFRKDGSGQLAGGIVKFNEFGDMDIGDIKVGAAGELGIYEGEEIRVLLSRQNIATLSEIASATQDSKINNASMNLTGVLYEYQYYNQPLEVITVRDNTPTSVTGSFSISISTRSGFRLSQGRATITVFVGLSSENSVASLGSATVQVEKLSGEAATNSSGIINFEKNVNLPVAGTYRIYAKIHFEGIGNESANTERDFYIVQGFLGDSSMHAKKDAARRITEIGKNGVGIIKDAKNYSFFGVENGNYKSVEKISNTAYYDKPGLLLSGIKWASGDVSFYFGSYGTTGSNKSGNDEYQIMHTIGHTDYTVILTPIAQNREWWVTEKASTYFKIKMNSTIDSQCEFAVFGNNKG